MIPDHRTCFTKPFYEYFRIDSNRVTCVSIINFISQAAIRNVTIITTSPWIKILQYRVVHCTIDPLPVRLF